MKVLDLMMMLEELDPNLDVMVDMTGDGADMFKLVAVETIEEVSFDNEDGEEVPVCLITPFPSPHHDINEN